MAARFTITIDGQTADLPDAVVARLQVFADRTNVAQKTALTVLGWLTLHLKELAVTDDLATAVEALRKQQQADAEAALEAAVAAARDQLLASLATTP
jgi:hypothetical protein